MILISDIKAAVAAEFGLPVRVMDEHSNCRAHARPRQVAMFLAHQLSGKSWTNIGRLFGGRDHATIIFGARAVADRLQQDQVLEYTVGLIRRRLAWGEMQ